MDTQPKALMTDASRERRTEIISRMLDFGLGGLLYIIYGKEELEVFNLSITSQPSEIVAI